MSDPNLFALTKSLAVERKLNSNALYELEKLRTQRDELLAACNGFLAWCRSITWQDCENTKRLDEIVVRTRDAIARCEGTTP
jgi:hypothetical protein